jgi:hypothetical protein
MKRLILCALLLFCWAVRIPRESCHPFHTKVATNSMQNLPLIP